jgi:Flp pilus assembly protein TadB
MWRHFAFNILVFCGAIMALAVASVPLFSSISLPFAVAIAALAILALAWATSKRTSKNLPILSLVAAFGAVALSSLSYHGENQHKPTLTELLAIHDRGIPKP